MRKDLSRSYKHYQSEPNSLLGTFIELFAGLGIFLLILESLYQFI